MLLVTVAWCRHGPQRIACVCNQTGGDSGSALGPMIETFRKLYCGKKDHKRSTKESNASTLRWGGSVRLGGTLTEVGRSFASTGMMKFLKPFLMGEHEEDNEEEEQKEADDDVDSELEKERDVTRTVHVLTHQECQVSVVDVLSLLDDDADGHNDSGTTPKIPLTLTYVMG
ncbi:hypothetical protein LSAT2_019579 [Lamellibrachia satsuma]|nr:hypothetical protein LSAT2_019579 [Lamellibrachia satsuma]